MLLECSRDPSSSSCTSWVRGCSCSSAWWSPLLGCCFPFATCGPTVLKTALWFALTLGFVPQVVWGQFCGQSYDTRIAAIHRQAEQLPGHQPTLLLTGSSSIRLWPEAPEAFPQFDVINAGFGGSCYADLWALRDTLLFAFEPDVVVIYEGDNDLSDGLPQSEILSSANARCSPTLPSACPTPRWLSLRPNRAWRRRHLGRGVQNVV